MSDSIDAATVRTPVGPLAVLVRDDVLVAAGFAAPQAHYDRLASKARAPLPALRTRRDVGDFTAALAAYVDGDLLAPDRLPVAQDGGPFRQAAWKLMREVPPGETITYAELARLAGNDKAVRAAGSACALNRIAPVIPCHRIVRTGGGLGGYYYGLSAKEWLLAHEREHAAG